MAIELDARAAALCAWRRARGRNDRLELRLERGSLRAGVPWILTAHWAPQHRTDGGMVSRKVAGVAVDTVPRIARYARFERLVISAARLGPWSWPVPADPFAYEHLREWESTHPSELFPLEGERERWPSAPAGAAVDRPNMPGDEPDAAALTLGMAGAERQGGW